MELHRIIQLKFNLSWTAPGYTTRTGMFYLVHELTFHLKSSWDFCHLILAVSAFLTRKLCFEPSWSNSNRWKASNERMLACAHVHKKQINQNHLTNDQSVLLINEDILKHILTPHFSVGAIITAWKENRKYVLYNCYYKKQVSFWLKRPVKILRIIF